MNARGICIVCCVLVRHFELDDRLFHLYVSINSVKLPAHYCLELLSRICSICLSRRDRKGVPLTDLFAAKLNTRPPILGGKVRIHKYDAEWTGGRSVGRSD